MASINKLKSLSEDRLKLILENEPNNLNVCKLLGLKFVQKGDFEESLKYFSKVVLLEESAENFYNLGVSLHNLKRVDEALVMYMEAINLDPAKHHYYSNIGAAYRDLQDYERALSNYFKSIELNENNNDYLNIAIILELLERYEDALMVLEFVVKRGDYRAEVRKLDLLKILGKDDCHSRLLEKINQSDGRSSLNRWITAQEQLLNGDYENGWIGFEERWKSGGLKEFKFKQPKWLGNFSIENKTLLVWSEQGLGDVIQFARYIPKLKKACAKTNIIFVVPLELYDLLKNIDGASKVILDNGELPVFDAQTPLMSLALILKSRIDNLEIDFPYIKPDQIKVNYWKEKLELISENKLKVGLVWSGGHRKNQPELFAINHRRNMPIQNLILLNGLDMNFFSLQKGNPAESELARLQESVWNGPNMFNFVADFNNFSDTAAFIENLDLIISVDTSTAHLAAAMGKQVWLLNRFDTCWRWLKHRTDSPWYPTLKIYRQPKTGDWRSVMLKIRNDLNDLNEILKIK